MIGWSLVALFIAIIVVAFVLQRRRKANKERSHYIILLDAFPATHVPLGAVVDRSEARGVAQALKVAYRASWAALTGIYGSSVREIPIGTIGITMGPVLENHSEVAWLIGTGKVLLKFQDRMYYWFVAELHNMFRYNMYGMDWVYETRDEDDRLKALEAQEWIEKNYGGSNGN